MVKTVRTVQTGLKGLFSIPGKTEEKNCIAVKTVSKHKPKRYIFVTFERVKNRVDLYGTI